MSPMPTAHSKYPKYNSYSLENSMAIIEKKAVVPAASPKPCMNFKMSDNM
jgi:hypothetical protein